MNKYILTLLISIFTVTGLFAQTSQDLDYNIVSSGPGYGLQGSQFVIELQMKATTAQAELGTGQMRISFNSDALTLNTGASSINSAIVNYDPYGAGPSYSSCNVYSPSTGIVQASEYLAITSAGFAYDIPTSWLNFAHIVFDINDPSQTSQIDWVQGDTEFYAEDNSTAHTNNSFAGAVDATLPVELSTFTAQFLNNVPTLYWRTESETENIGWYVYRGVEDDFTTTERVTDLLEGHGTTSEPHDYFYYDEELEAIHGDMYWYWIESIDLGGQFNSYGPKVITIPPDYNPEPVVEKPIEYGLHQNKPNPFVMGSGSTKISFALPKTAYVELKIYNILGELVRNLYSGPAYGDKLIEVEWNGRNESGVVQAPGIYLYQLKVEGKSYQIKRLILLR